MILMTGRDCSLLISNNPASLNLQLPDSDDMGLRRLDNRAFRNQQQ